MAERGRLQGQQRALLDSIRLHYGSALCVRGEVEEGLAHLALDSGASPVALLRLFPGIAPAALLEPLLPRLPGAGVTPCVQAVCPAGAWLVDGVDACLWGGDGGWGIAVPHVRLLVHAWSPCCRGTGQAGCLARSCSEQRASLGATAD